MRYFFVLLGFLSALSSCGQDPSFVDASLTQASPAIDSPSADAVAAEDGSVEQTSPASSSFDEASMRDVPPVTTPLSSRAPDVVATVPVRQVAPTPTPAAPSLPTAAPAAPSLPTAAPAAPSLPTAAPAAPSLPTAPVAPSPAPNPSPATIAPTFPSQPSNPSSPVFSVPGLTPSEQVQVAQCITKWGRVPFTGTFTNVRRIKAAVSVYGIGTVINDTIQTSTPALILVDAGVNVMGNPVYNLMNNNGYYCMKVNVNVHTDLDINLACNAKLADNSVQVNVASTTNSETGVIGVNVGSNVQVTRMTSTRSECAY